MAAVAVSHVYPLGSRLNEQGRLEVGGCDVVELAREFGTPAYVYAEDDMRSRARAYQQAFRARTERFEVIYGGKAFPATAAFRLFAEAGLGCIVVDSFDEIDRLRGRGPRVMLRVTPGIRPDTHSYIQTGQEDSKF